MAAVRVIYPTPKPRSSEVGIELEREVTISLVNGRARGFYGGVTGLPTPPSQPALGGPLATGNSLPFDVQLTAADVESIIRLILTRSGMAGTVRVDV
jgi:hypothetical protein